LGPFVSYTEKSLIKFAPGLSFELMNWDNVIKNFYVRELRMLAINWSVCPWQAFLKDVMVTNKAGNYPIESPFRCSTRVGSALSHKQLGWRGLPVTNTLAYWPEKHSKDKNLLGATPLKLFTAVIYRLL